MSENDSGVAFAPPLLVSDSAADADINDVFTTESAVFQITQTRDGHDCIDLCECSEDEDEDGQDEHSRQHAHAVVNDGEDNHIDLTDDDCDIMSVLTTAVRSQSTPIRQETSGAALSRRRTLADFFSKPPAKRIKSDTQVASALKAETAALIKDDFSAFQIRDAMSNERSGGAIKAESAEKWKMLLKSPDTTTVARGRRGRGRAGPSIGGFVAHLVQRNKEDEAANKSATGDSFQSPMSLQPNRDKWCPPFKLLIHGATRANIDGFQYAQCQPFATSYFLSHFHADHTIGLKAKWNTALIHCSPVTATLLQQHMRIAPEHIQPIPLHHRILIDGMYVTLIDAHHCPGAVVFIFECPPFRDECIDYNTSSDRRDQSHGPVYIHCGDFRYHPHMDQLFLPPTNDLIFVKPEIATYFTYPSLPFQSMLSHLRELRIDCVYLDTTYLGPQYIFPPQNDSVAYIVEQVQHVLTREHQLNEKNRIKTEVNAQHMKSAQHTSADTDSDVTIISHTSPTNNNITMTSRVTSLVSNVWSQLTTSLATISTSFLSGYVDASTQRTLFLIGSYQIGKEKCFLSVAKKFGMKIYGTKHKISVLNCLNLFDNDILNDHDIQTKQEGVHLYERASNISDDDQHDGDDGDNTTNGNTRICWSKWCADDVFTENITETRLHVVSMRDCSIKGVSQYIDPLHNSFIRPLGTSFNRVVAFRPTGWVGERPSVVHRTVDVSIIGADKVIPKKPIAGARPIAFPKRAVHVSIHQVPYSEHSKHSELEAFIRMLSQCGLRQIIPTVSYHRSQQLIQQHFNPLLYQAHTTKLEHSLSFSASNADALHDMYDDDGNDHVSMKNED